MSAPVTTEAHMSHETTTTIADNLTADPELRFTGSGGRAAHFTAASRVSTPRSGDSQTG